ncbi:hypothetical protein LguiB_022875 [Lonicera macranthoides]
MMEVQDTVIKLFGKKITLPENGKITVVSGADYARESGATVDHKNSTSHQDCILIKMYSSCLEDKKVDRVGEEEPHKKEHLAEESTNSKPFPDSVVEEIAALEHPKSENNQSDATNSEKKTLKKPDKILPCPRCNSMETKFCYYNNYNVNQPRHFCKSCQRYWTSGGTMRNMPIGAGRRKNKNHTASFCLPNHTPNEILRPNFQPNGTVLSFNSGESMACDLSLGEKKSPNSTQNGIYNLDQGIVVPCKGEENGNDYSIRSSIADSNSMVGGARNGIIHNIHEFPPQFPCLHGVPWPYPWNSTIPISGIPNPVYPAPYWNCNVLGAWSNPWLSSPFTSNQVVPNSGFSSSALRKHSRNGDLLNRSIPKMEEKTCERPILVPQTLRINDPDEAAKSSIWKTLGIKKDSTCRGGFFQAKVDGKKHEIAAVSSVLQANPAAMSRFLSFQERA